MYEIKTIYISGFLKTPLMNPLLRQWAHLFIMLLYSEELAFLQRAFRPDDRLL